MIRTGSRARVAVTVFAASSSGFQWHCTPSTSQFLPFSQSRPPIRWRTGRHVRRVFQPNMDVQAVRDQRSRLELKLNRKTAGQPFSYSSFKFPGPGGNPQVEAPTSLRGDPPSLAGVLGHVECMSGPCWGLQVRASAPSDMIPAQQAWTSRSCRGHVGTMFKPSGQGLNIPPA